MNSNLHCFFCCWNIIFREVEYWLRFGKLVSIRWAVECGLHCALNNVCDAINILGCLHVFICNIWGPPSQSLTMDPLPPPPPRLESFILWLPHCFLITLQSRWTNLTVEFCLPYTRQGLQSSPNSDFFSLSLSGGNKSHKQVTYSSLLGNLEPEPRN